MEIRIDRDAFAKALGSVQGVVERKHTMPVLANALLSAQDDSLEIVVTDLEICMRNRIPSLSTETPGTVTINARKLYEVVKELPDPAVELRAMDNDWVEIRSGRSLFHIAGLPAQDFPTIPSMEDAVYRTVPEKHLRRLLSLVEYAISTDETRYHLNGVYVESRTSSGSDEVRFVATDGHRLSLATASSADLGGLKLDEGVILPRKAVVELRKLLDGDQSVDIAFGKNHASLRKRGLSMLFQYVDGEFPEYERVIPKGEMQRAIVKRAQFLRALQRISLVSADRTHGAKLDLHPGELRLSANHPDIGEAVETLEIEYGGDELSIGFNATYLLDVFRVLEADEVELDVKDGLSQGAIREKDNPHFLAIVMPMRI